MLLKLNASIMLKNNMYITIKNHGVTINRLDLLGVSDA